MQVFNYSSFRTFGKNLFINFGEIIDQSSVDPTQSDGNRNQLFNTQLKNALKPLVFEIGKTDIPRQKKLLENKPSLVQWVLGIIPAFAGWLLHLPIYLPLKKITYSKTNHNDHYDSVFIALLMFTYPLYLLLLSSLLFYWTGSPYAFFAILLLPFTAWAYIQLKPQLDGQ